MIIGERLRLLREQKNLTQVEIQDRTGFFSSYVSRIENGHSVPSVETLQKWARALDIPIYQLFYERGRKPKAGNHTKPDNSKADAWGRSGKDARMLRIFRQLFSQMDQRDIKIVLYTAQKMARTKRR